MKNLTEYSKTFGMRLQGLSLQRTAIVLIFFFSFLISNAQKPIDSLSFSTDGGIKTAVLDGSKLYIGGDFDYVGKKTGTAVFFHNGSSVPDYNMPVFGQINPQGDGTYHEVGAVLPDGRGGWFVGGNFLQVNGRKHALMAHILPDKQVDEGFAMPFPDNSNGAVVILKRDGNFVYVGGRFDFSFNGTAYNNIFRFDAVTFAIDESWQPKLLHSTYISRIEISKNEVFLAGNIGQVEGVDRKAMVVLNKVSAKPVSFPSTDMSPPVFHLMGDTLIMGKTYFPSVTTGFGYVSGGVSLFDAGGDPLNSDSTVNGLLMAAISDGNDGYYALGRYGLARGVLHLDSELHSVPGFSQTKLSKFDIAGADISLYNNSLYVTSAEDHQGVSVSVNGKTIKALFKLDATTGTIDPDFRPNPNGQVYATLLKGDTLFVAGSFNEIGGVARTGLAAVNARTGAVYDWDPSFDDFDGFYLGFGDHHVSDLILLHDTLYASGVFMTKSNTGNNISSLVRFDMSDGHLDTNFHLFTGRSNLPDFVSMAYDGSSIYVAGNFEMDAGAGTVKNVGILYPGTKQFVPFSSTLDFNLLEKMPYNAQGVPKITIVHDTLYISGYDVEQLPQKMTRRYFAAIDLSSKTFAVQDPAPSSAVYSMAVNGQKLLLSGLFELVKWYPNNLMGINIKTKAYVLFPSVILGIQHGLAFAHNDKYLFIGSGFRKYGDSTVNGLIRLKRKGLHLTRFEHKIADGAPFFIQSMSLSENGLYVSGYYNGWVQNTGAFYTVAGQNRQNICLIDPETAALKNWNPPPYNAESCSVFSFGDEVVLAGKFTLMPAWEHRSVACFDMGKMAFTDWKPQVEGSLVYTKALLVAGDTLFVGGGGFDKINGHDVTNLFALSKTSGALLTGFVPVDEEKQGINALYKKGSKLYVSGAFTRINGKEHNKVARINAADGSVDDWDPRLEGSWNLGVNGFLVQDTSVWMAGSGLSVSGNSSTGPLVRVGAATGALQKIYSGNNQYDNIGSLVANARGDVAVGMMSNLTDDLDFYLLDRQSDTMVPVKGMPHFRGGIHQVIALGNHFIGVGNDVREKNTATNKPAVFVYNPEEDTVTAAFSLPVLDKYNSVNALVANDKVLVVAGNFGGMNQDIHNGDIAFMQTPELNLQPAVSSLNPKTANNADPFSLTVNGYGFTQNSKLSLISGSQNHRPDSIQVSRRKMVAFFNGSRFATGKYDVRIEITPDNPLLFSNAFEIQKAEKTMVWIDFTGPDEVLINRPTKFYLSFGNKGSRAAYGVFLYLAVGEKQRVDWPAMVSQLKPDVPVDWDTVPSFVKVDYFMGRPFKGKVYSLFVPYMPAGFHYTMAVKLTSAGTESSSGRILFAVNGPLFPDYDALVQSEKSTDGVIYSFFRCTYDVVGVVADLTPGVGCVKSFFDNTVIAGMDKYMKNESVSVYDVSNSVGMIALGCVPGGAELGKAVEISKKMVEYGTGTVGAFSSCKDFVDHLLGDEKNLDSRFSHDPNAKYGPSGSGTSVFVPTDKAYQYMITFENDAAATAPAQRVIITDTLDKNVFDLSSFHPRGFAFGDTTYFYKNNDGDTVDIDLRPHKNIIVRVFYALSQDDGILTWTFLTLDPSTYQLTEHVNDGFLPPNHVSPEGEGSVFYSVTPRQGLADSTMINNSAHILFDWNETIPTGIWHNVADNTLPESAVEALPAKETDKNFNITWGGSDRGSGIYAYTIYVAENDSAYYPWLIDTHETTAVFSGTAGVTYKFYSVATDSAGNKEIAPSSYDAITQVSATGVDNFGESQKQEFSIYPNPSTGRVTFAFSLPATESLRVDLMNSCGHLVRELYIRERISGKGKINMNLISLPAGLYFVRIQTASGIQTRKLIKR